MPEMDDSGDLDPWSGCEDGDEEDGSVDDEDDSEDEEESEEEMDIYQCAHRDPLRVHRESEDEVAPQMGKPANLGITPAAASSK